jgi:hypothetical protein
MDFNVKRLIKPKTLFSVILFLLLIFFFQKTSKYITLLFITGILVLPLAIIKDIFIIKIQPKELHPRLGSLLDNLILIIVSIMLCLISLELGIRVSNKIYRVYFQKYDEIPKELAQKNVYIEGAESARYWQGKLHVYGKDGFRHIDNFSQKRKGVLRIMAIGDSLTYGTGIDAKDVYTKVIEDELSKNYWVEVLNLGYDAAQPSDLIITLKKYLPILKPDLVIYGVCQNDILPHEKQPYVSNMLYPFPLPDNFKLFMENKTAIGQFFSKGYDKLLLKFEIRNDYLGDFINGYYQDNFKKEIKVMNDYVINNNITPIISMVLDNTPNEKTKKVTSIIEQILEKEGMQVIPTNDFYERYFGLKFQVSRWEPHPNEEAHKIYAQTFVDYLSKLPELKKYKK